MGYTLQYLTENQMRGHSTFAIHSSNGIRESSFFSMLIARLRRRRNKNHTTSMSIRNLKVLMRFLTLIFKSVSRWLKKKQKLKLQQLHNTQTTMMMMTKTRSKKTVMMMEWRREMMNKMNMNRNRKLRKYKIIARMWTIMIWVVTQKIRKTNQYRDKTMIKRKKRYEVDWDVSQDCSL